VSFYVIEGLKQQNSKKNRKQQPIYTHTHTHTHTHFSLRFRLRNLVKFHQIELNNPFVIFLNWLRIVRFIQLNHVRIQFDGIWILKKSFFCVCSHCITGMPLSSLLIHVILWILPQCIWNMFENNGFMEWCLLETVHVQICFLICLTQIH